MNVRHPIWVYYIHFLSKTFFYDKMDLRLFYIRVTRCIVPRVLMLIIKSHNFQSWSNDFKYEKMNISRMDYYEFSTKKKINPLSSTPTKWSNTIKQFVGNDVTILKVTSKHVHVCIFVGSLGNIYLFQVNKKKYAQS